MNKIKVLLITQYVPHYRIPIYSMLGERVELTILHSQPKLKSLGSHSFRQVYVGLRSIGPLLSFKTNLYKFCQNFEVVISESNIRFVDRNIVSLVPWRKFKWISWGIGQAASYNKRLGDRDPFQFVRMFLQKRSDASILYSSFPLDLYTKSGIDPHAIFVANNTISLGSVAEPSASKNSVLFVGTLYKQKKIMELIRAYRSALKRCAFSIPIFVIGDGPEGNKLKTYVKELGLQEAVIFLGRIEDPYTLSEYFSNALACISPGQAGLSVLTSMANSTPFITRENAITGGEIFNINNGKNQTGVIYKTEKELADVLCDINFNREKYIKMGADAKDYYTKYRLPEHMVDSMVKAIRYVVRV